MKKNRAKFCFDLGASGTKGWVQVIGPGKAGIEETIFQVSRARRVTDAYYENLHLENNKQGSHLSFGNHCWVVGSYAEDSVLKTKPNQIKNHHAIAKILSVVGYYVRQYGSGLEVEIDLLLPSDEKPYFRAAEELIFKHLRQFNYGIESLACTPIRVDVHPEGAGVASYASVFPCSILMFGHRDITSINLKSPGTDISNNAFTWGGWGTMRLLQNFPHAFSNELTGAELLFSEARAWGKGGLTHHLMKMMSEKECKAKIRALEEARDLIWGELADQLSIDTDFMNSRKIYIAGGGAVFWFNYLSQLCASKADILDSVRREVIATAGKGLSKDLQLRLIDSYLVWRQSAKPVLKLQNPPAREVTHA